MSGSIAAAAFLAVVYAWGWPVLRSIRSRARSAFASDRLLVLYGGAFILTLLLAVDWLRLLGHLFPLALLGAASWRGPAHRLWFAIGAQAVASSTVAMAGWRPSLALATACLTSQAALLTRPSLPNEAPPKGEVVA